MSSIVSVKVIGVTVAVLTKQYGGATVINKVDNFSRLLPKSGNFLICPISLESLLALIQVGSTGETAKQISVGLKLPISTQRLLDTYLALHPLEKTDEHYQLKTFRKLFFNDAFHLSSTYKDETVKYFHVDIQNLKLLPAPKALRSFDEWLNKCTESSMQNDFLSTTALTKETRAIFGNIVSLKGVWVSGFQKNPTLKRNFFIDAHHYVEIEMLDIVSKFNYYQNEKIRAKFLELTYENSDSSLNVVLPYDINGLSNVETSIQTIIRETNYRQTIVNVRVPKMELKTVIPFNNILQQLGIKKAFQDNADLSLISDTNEDKLKIDGVMQETYIKMEEKEDTSDNFQVTIPRNTPIPEYVTFYLNHPFILILKDKQKGVFFMGRFLQPEGQILTGSYQEEMDKFNLFERLQCLAKRQFVWVHERQYGKGQVLLLVLALKERLGPSLCLGV